MESMSVRAFAGGAKTRREFAAVASPSGVTTNVSPLQRAQSFRSPEATAALTGKTTNPLARRRSVRMSSRVCGTLFCALFICTDVCLHLQGSVGEEGAPAYMSRGGTAGSSADGIELAARDVGAFEGSSPLVQNGNVVFDATTLSL